MKAYIKRGDSLFIPFAQGLSIPGVQKKMKVYKSLENLEKSKPTFYQLDDNVEVVEYAEVKHGEWKAYGLMNPQCSLCRKYNIEKSRFCPNCGAKMDGGAQK